MAVMLTLTKQCSDCDGAFDNRYSSSSLDSVMEIEISSIERSCDRLSATGRLFTIRYVTAQHIGLLEFVV